MTKMLGKAVANAVKQELASLPIRRANSPSPTTPWNLEALPPADASAWFLTATDERQALVSSTLVFPLDKFI